MADYTLAVGTGDPHPLIAPTSDDAVGLAVSFITAQLAGEWRAHPEQVVTLLGPDGLVTRPSERLDEFVGRVRALASDTLQPGDANTPDCNGD